MKGIRTEIEPESNDIRTAVVPICDLDRTTGRYSNTHLATDLGVSEGAIRKWFVKLCEVCPDSWLKVSGKHTDLSAALLADYKDSVSTGGMAAEAWVVEMRGQFSDSPRQVDVLPADSALALVSNDKTATALDIYLQELGADIVDATRKVDQLVDDLEADEVALLQAEIEAARSKGAKKALLIYGAEKQGQNETTQVLRQREIERKRQGGQ